MVLPLIGIGRISHSGHGIPLLGESNHGHGETREQTTGVVAICETKRRAGLQSPRDQAWRQYDSAHMLIGIGTTCPLFFARYAKAPDKAST